MFVVKIVLFGIFRDYLGDEVNLSLNIDTKVDICFLKKYMSCNILIKDLSFLESVLYRSSFASDGTVLMDDFILNSGDKLFLLPPFSGG